MRFELGQQDPGAPPAAHAEAKAQVVHLDDAHQDGGGGGLDLRIAGTEPGSEERRLAMP